MENGKNQDTLKLGIQPFWFWNGRMEPDEIVRQIEEMKEQGISGFIIHPRQGMEIPYLSDAYFERVRLAVDTARKHQMEVWLYDEYPYPSGVTAGRVTLDHPEYQCKMLDKTEYTAKPGEEVILDIPWGKILSAKAYPMEGDTVLWDEGMDISHYIGIGYQEDIFQLSGLTQYNHKRYFSGKQTMRLWWNAPNMPVRIYVFAEVVMTGFKYFDTFVDTLNPDAVRHFLKTTHEFYKEKLGEEFGRTVKGVFTDEITAFPPGRPWSPLLPSMMLEKTGIPILEYLPVLFDADMGERTKEIRYAYWNTCTDAFIESYDKQVYEWCEREGIYFIGEKPIMRSKQLAWFHCPGIDAGHQKVGAKAVIAPGKYRANGKMVSSAAHFYNKPAALCEAFHSIGWGMTLQDMKWTFDWLLVHGIDWFIVHGFFYTTNGLKKHDAPPSAFFQMPWWKDMRHLSQYAGQLIRTVRQAKRKVLVLLLDPVTSYWTADEKDKAGVLEEFSRLQRALFSYQLDYYIIDPQLLAQGQVRCQEGRTELLINGEGFPYVMLPSIHNLEDSCFQKIKEFAASGGALAAVGSLAEERIMERNPKDWMNSYFKEGSGKSLYGKTPDEACEQLKKAVGGYVLTGADGLGMDEILSVEYEKENGDRFYFIVNTSKENRVLKGNILKGELELGALQSGFYPLDQKGFLTLPKESETEIGISLDGQWDMELHAKNVLRLGFWKLKSETTGQETDTLVESMPVIDQIKKGNMLIPLESKEAFGCPKDLVLSPDTYLYQTEFEAEEEAIAKPAYLVVEPQGIRGEWEIELNGHVFVAADFKKQNFYLPDNQAVLMKGCLKAGKNELFVRVQAADNSSGINSPLYILGSFGVEVKGERLRLIKEPVKGSIKNAKESLVPFYAGSITYEKSIKFSNIPEQGTVKIKAEDPWLQDSAALSINGHELGVRDWAEYAWEAPAEIFKPGENKVSLCITNTMSGLFEGQYFNREQHRYENVLGREAEIEVFETGVHK